MDQAVEVLKEIQATLEEILDVLYGFDEAYLEEIDVETADEIEVV